MSKRKPVPVLDRPIKPVPAPCCRRAIITSGGGKRPVEPSRKNVTISFDQVDPTIIDYAPIHFYLRPWCDGRYSEQCLRRMLTNVIDQESWHALRGVEEHRYLHSANCTLIEALLRALDEREVEVAA